MTFLQQMCVHLPHAAYRPSNYPGISGHQPNSKYRCHASYHFKIHPRRNDHLPRSVFLFRAFYYLSTHQYTFFHLTSNKFPDHEYYSLKILLQISCCQIFLLSLPDLQDLFPNFQEFFQNVSSFINFFFIRNHAAHICFFYFCLLNILLFLHWYSTSHQE